jgi:hypothetical protein
MNRSTSIPTRAVTLGLSFIVAVAGALGAAPARADEVQMPREFAQRYDDAVAALMTQRYVAAYGRFAALADQGHAPAALMALAMVRYRPSVVGAAWSASPGQLRRWGALAADPLQESDTLLAGYDAGE